MVRVGLLGIILIVRHINIVDIGTCLYIKIDFFIFFGVIVVCIKGLKSFMSAFVKSCTSFLKGKLVV